MSQFKLLPGGAGELSVDFLGHRCRAATVDGVPFLAAVDVAGVLGLAGDGETVTRWLDDQEKGPASFRTPGGPQEMVGVTMAGAMAMALARRRGAPEGIREKLDALVLALGTGAAPALAPASNQELTALRQEVATLTALVRAIPVHASEPKAEDVARAVAVALETYHATAWKRRSDAIKAGQMGARVRTPPVPPKPKAPALTESDVLRALQSETGHVGADNLARRHGWGRQAVREMLLAMERAGRVEYGRHGPKGQGWRVRPEVV